MIGICDYDFITSTKKFCPPNLEAMKMASYLRNEQNTPCRLLTQDIRDTEEFDKVYFFSNLPLNELPDDLLIRKNFEFHGYYLDGNQYVPLQPKLAEYMLPDINIYKPWLRDKYKNEIMDEKTIDLCLNSTYYRMFVNGELMPLPPIQKRKKIFLYDYELFQRGWEKGFSRLENSPASSIITLNPVLCTNMTQYFTVRKNPKFNRANIVILDFYIPPEQVSIFIAKYKMRLLEDIVPSSSVFFYLGKNYIADFYSDNFYKKNLYNSLNLLYTYWANKIPMKVKVFPRKTSVLNPYEVLFEYVEKWTKKFATTNEAPSLREYLSSRKNTSLDLDKMLSKDFKWNNVLDITPKEVEAKGFWNV